MTDLQSVPQRRPAPNPNLPSTPEPRQVSTTVVIPDYPGPPPDTHEMTRRQARYDRALQRYQAALAEFDTRDPPLPCRSDTWPDANARSKRRKAFLKPHLDELNTARSHYRDGICHRARSRLD